MEFAYTVNKYDRRFKVRGGGGALKMILFDSSLFNMYCIFILKQNLLHLFVFFLFFVSVRLYYFIFVVFFPFVFWLFLFFVFICIFLFFVFICIFLFFVFICIFLFFVFICIFLFFGLLYQTFYVFGFNVSDFLCFFCLYWTG